MSEAVTLCSATLGEDGNVEPPLGPLYIAAALEQSGVSVDFRDFQLDPTAHGLSGLPLAEFLEGHHEVLMISCFVDMLPAVIDACRLLNAERPDTTIIIGGPGPTAGARRIVEKYPWISGVVRGEGEETIREWIKHRRRGSTGPVAGMVYRAGETIHDGPRRDRILRLDALPRPAYHLIDWSCYQHARVITTRGCPYHCSFCDVAVLWGNRSTYRGLDETIEEMEMLRDRYGKTSISIVDDTFVLDRDRVRQFCRRLLERRSNVEWGCFGRINLMSPDLVALMAKAGCRAVFYGIDSGSPTVLKVVHKVIRAEEILRVVRFSAEHFDRIEASFIWGYPFERLDQFKETLELAGEVSLLAPQVNVQMHMLSPLPNSPILHSFKGRLREPEPEDQRWLLLPALLLEGSESTTGEIVRSDPELFPGFYTFPTRAKPTKRKLLDRAFRALDRTVGRTLFNPRIARLVNEDVPAIERELLDAETHPSDRIGVGLAIGFLRRSRRLREETSAFPFDAGRGAQLVRQRNDLPTGSACP